MKPPITNHQSLITKSGFTLIELLVSVGLLGFIMLASTSLFFTALNSKKKLESSILIKQSGTYAMQIMSRLFRNATGVTSSCVSSMSSISISSPDGGTTTFSCSSASCPSAVGSDRIASNSACLTANNLTLSGCSFDCDNTLAGKPPTVTVKFTLTKGTAADMIGYASQAFRTTTSIRKY